MNVHALMMLESPDRGSVLREVQLSEESWLSIGRDGTNNVVLDSNAVSRHHARIRVRDGKVVIEDLGSLNGTFVLDPRRPEQRLSASSPRHASKNRMALLRRRKVKAVLSSESQVGIDSRV